MKEWIRVTIMIMVLFSGCKAIEKKAFIRQATTAPTATPSYTCSYYSEYDDLSTCQTTSLANCTSEWQTFPSGGIALCYKPVVGWEACSITPPSWTYSVWSAWCDTGTTDLAANKIYRENRSLITCSSAICACLSAQVLTRICTDSVDCAVVDATFNPLAAPTPAPCP